MMNVKSIVSIFIMLAVTGIQAENLLKNSSFEDGKNNPENWLRYLITPEQAIHDEKAAHNGKRGVGLTSTSHKYGGGWIYEEIIPVVPGEKYCLSGWIKSESWGDNCISVAWFEVKNGRPTWKTTSSSELVNGKKDWTQVILNVTVPENISFAKINLGRRCKTEGAVYFDDISFEKLSDSKTAANTLDIPWQNALPAEKKSPDKTFFPEEITAENWEKVHDDAGTLQKIGAVLQIKDSALDGVGWVSPSLELSPGETYIFQAEIELNKAYHVALGVALFDASGNLLEIRAGESLQGTRKIQERLVFRTTLKTASVRFLLTQSRSSGTSSFSKLILFK